MPLVFNNLSRISHSTASNFARPTESSFSCYDPIRVMPVKMINVFAPACLPPCLHSTSFTLSTYQIYLYEKEIFTPIAYANNDSLCATSWTTCGSRNIDLYLQLVLHALIFSAQNRFEGERTWNKLRFHKMVQDEKPLKALKPRMEIKFLISKKKLHNASQLAKFWKKNR